MKRILFALFTVTAIVLTSCSKDQKINRQLDGKWNATIVEGLAVNAPASLAYEFSKEKKGKGTGNMIAGYGGFTFSSPFSYEIRDEKLSIINDSTITLEITDHSKKKMVFVNVASGKSTTLEKAD